jgi:hypothetical protein
LEHRDDVIRATILHDGVKESVEASWVVGCDRVHSATGTFCRIDLIGHDIAEPWAAFDALLTGWPNSHEVNYVYLDDIPVILTALPGQRLRVYLRPPSADSDLVADASETRRRYLRADRVRRRRQPGTFLCHTKVASRFRSGRVFLASDAAYICSPAQGHGMNAGLQDAFNLAWRLALVCNGDGAPDQLDSYEAERRQVAERIAASGDMAEQIQIIAGPAARRSRDKTLRRCCRPDLAPPRGDRPARCRLYRFPIMMGDHNAAIVGADNFHVVFTGQQNRAGTKRMAVRRDAGVALIRLAAAIAHAAERHAPGLYRPMPRGAGHDAQIMSQALPAAMLFVPSIGGIRHYYNENTADADLVLGCEVFADAAAEILRG